jgi:hypothetical protein
MPSSIQLFIRVPKHISSEVIFDNISEMEVCKVCSVKIVRVNKRRNAAMVTIHYWYKGTKDIRDNLNRGEAMYIPNHGNDFVAYKYISKKSEEARDDASDERSMESFVEFDLESLVRNELDDLSNVLEKREKEERENYLYALSCHCSIYGHNEVSATQESSSKL